MISTQTGKGDLLHSLSLLIQMVISPRNTSHTHTHKEINLAKSVDSLIQSRWYIILTIKSLQIVSVTHMHTVYNNALFSKENNNEVICCCSITKSCLTLCNPVIAACQAPLSSIISQSLFKFMSVESVKLSISFSVASFCFCLQSFPVFILSQYQSLFQSVGSLHLVAKVLKFQLQQQFFQWIFRVDFL